MRVGLSIETEYLRIKQLLIKPLRIKPSKNVFYSHISLLLSFSLLNLKKQKAQARAMKSGKEETENEK